MLKPGIKVSLMRQSIADLAETTPPAAEVWFDVSRYREYVPLFGQLRKLKTETGLHFWGKLPDGTMANIAYPSRDINRASVKLIKQAIDIASDNGFVYVNIHPTQRALVKVDFAAMSYPSVGKPAQLNDAIKRFIDHTLELTEYAKSGNVVFTVETVSRLSPATDWYNPKSRLKPINIFDLPVEANLKAAERGVAVANDFVHTATHSPDSSRQGTYKYLVDITHRLAGATRLIHLGFLVPPYNGVDNHDMLNNPLFKTDEAIPNRKEAKDLLRQFKNKDIWVITEPRHDHVLNFRETSKLLSEL